MSFYGRTFAEIYGRTFEQIYGRDGLFASGDEDTVTGIVAGGNTQATATQLTATFNVIATVTNAGDAVALPDGAAGRVCKIKNSGAKPAQIFPKVGASARINTSSVDAVGATIQPGAMMWFEGESSTQWHV